MAQKGVSPVVATILMVMITIALVAFSYSWFKTIAVGVTTTSNKMNTQMEKEQQEIRIGTVFVNGTGLYFQLIASGVNSIPIEMDGSYFYINDVPKPNVSVWGHSTECNVTLAPGESCYGRITDYNSSNCHIGDIFKVLTPWNLQAFKKIGGCTRY